MHEDLAVVVMRVEQCGLLEHLLIGSGRIPSQAIGYCVGPLVERRVKLDDHCTLTDRICAMLRQLVDGVYGA